MPKQPKKGVGPNLLINLSGFGNPTGFAKTINYFDPWPRKASKYSKMDWTYKVYNFIQPAITNFVAS